MQILESARSSPVRAATSSGSHYSSESLNWVATAKTFHSISSVQNQTTPATLSPTEERSSHSMSVDASGQGLGSIMGFENKYFYDSDHAEPCGSYGGRTA